ncbi:Z1 domain-containing protein [Candidatus Actinomarina sp.]|nr:Z1 domain-containing protein [Candidatus Actinomarina sp.]
MLKMMGSEALLNMPALIIDDEADSASPTPFNEPDEDGERELQATNKRIRQLIKTLPRAQYVAYTATPYANVFTTSDDKDDLFPGDFIAQLEAPDEYMGPEDFISDDISKNFRDEEFSPYVRDVMLSDEDIYIQKALDAFLLSGAIKLYRESQLGLNVGDKYNHHTMLVHSSHKNIAQDEMAEKFQTIWDLGDYTSAGLVRLQKLYFEDFLVTSEKLDSDLNLDSLPSDFKELLKFINTAKALIANDEKIYLIINQHNPAPSFSKEVGEPGVWKIITGGNMLSRGFTIPDLTISYFTRPVTAGDTLEQMARWFGYRIGYKDLVRLYIARDARDGSVDLYQDFIDICNTETNLRDLFKKLPVSKEESFRRDVSPRDYAIYVVQEGRLAPTAASKMRNIGSVSENFGGKPFDKSQKFPKQGSKEDVNNMELFQKLLDSTSLEKEEFSFSKDKSSRKFWIGDIKNIDFYEFLKKFIWTVEDPTKVLQWYLNGNLECPKSRKESDYYEEYHECSPSIDKWKLIINDGDSRLDDQYSKYKYKDYEFVVVGRSESKLQGWKSLENRADVKYVNYINDEESKNYGRASKELKNSYELNTGIIHGYLVDNIENPTGKPSFGYVIKKLPKNNCRNEVKLIPENQLSYE